MKNKLCLILKTSISKQDLYLDQPIDLSDGDNSELYSESGQLDSLSLITIIADVEKQILSQFSIKVQLATERDLCISDSPFNTFGSMLDFIKDRVKSAISIENQVA